MGAPSLHIRKERFGAKTRSVGPQPEGCLRKYDPPGGIPEFGERSFAMGPRGMWYHSKRIREGVGATSCNLMQ